MVEVLGNIVDNILFIKNEKRKILDYIANLDNQRRNEILIAEGFGGDVCSSGAKKTT